MGAVDVVEDLGDDRQEQWVAIRVLDPHDDLRTAGCVSRVPGGVRMQTSIESRDASCVCELPRSDCSVVNVHAALVAAVPEFGVSSVAARRAASRTALVIPIWRSKMIANCTRLRSSSRMTGATRASSSSA